METALAHRQHLPPRHLGGIDRREARRIGREIAADLVTPANEDREKKAGHDGEVPASSGGTDAEGETCAQHVQQQVDVHQSSTPADSCPRAKFRNSWAISRAITSGANRCSTTLRARPAIAALRSARSIKRVRAESHSSAEWHRRPLDPCSISSRL